MDSKHVYVFNSSENKIEIFNLMLQKEKTIEMDQVIKSPFATDLKNLFDESVSVGVFDDLLYYFTSTKAYIHQLPDFKLIGSFFNFAQTDSSNSLLSRHLAKDLGVLRYKDQLKYINLKNGSFYVRTYGELNLNDVDLHPRVLGEDKLMFFNSKTNQYFIPI